MSKIPVGATDAFNAIVQKIDETLIQAEAHLRMQRLDAQANGSLPEMTVVPSKSGQSERSRSPAPRGFSRSSSRASSKSPGFCRSPSSASSASSACEVIVKSKAYVAVDKKKGVVMTSIKCEPGMDVELEVKKVEKLIEGLFNSKGSASSASSHSYIQF